MNLDRSNMVLRHYIGFENQEARFEQLIDFLSATGIHRVILFSSNIVEESSILPLSYYRKHAAMLRPYVEQLKQMDVEVGINVLCTNGHCYYADENEFGFRRAVTINGDGSRGSVCYRDEKFLEFIKQEYRCYAALQPSVIFTDDDIRALSMGQMICLCDHHVKLISECVGKDLTFAQIQQELLGSSLEISPIKQAYFDQIRDDIEFLVSEIADVVHEVSPDTEIGVMTTSYPSVTLDRDLSSFFDKLYDSKKVTRIRTGMDYYREGDHGDIPMMFSMPLIQREFMGLDCKAEIQPEIENDIYGFFYKSNAVTKMQLVWCLSNGLKNMQLNLFDLLNCYDCNYQEIKQMFHNEMPYFNALGTLVPTGHRTEGVNIYVHPRALLARRAKSGGIMFRAFWHKWLNLMGIPLASDRSRAQCVLLTGDDIALASDGEIDAMLKKGAIIDKRAAEVLLHRGYGERIGLVDIHDVDGLFSGERFTDHALNEPYRGSHNSNYFMDSLISPDLVGKPQYADGAQVLSVIVNHKKKKVCDGIAVYENADGERVCIFPFDYGAFSMFTNLNDRRKHQLIHILEWLSRRALPVIAGNEKMCVNLNVLDTRNVITLFNTASDEIARPKLRYAPIGKLKYLSKNGRLMPLKYEKEGEYLLLKQPIKALGVLVLTDER